MALQYRDPKSPGSRGKVWSPFFLNFPISSQLVAKILVKTHHGRPSFGKFFTAF